MRGNRILPHFVHGFHAITISSLVEQGKPLIWRGPMAHGAFKLLLLDNTEWPELDYLIVDLPPDTGDVPLTLCQLLPLTGAVLVATPQQVALDDAIRAVRMFQQLGAPVLGMVEDMSYFIDANGIESTSSAAAAPTGAPRLPAGRNVCRQTANIRGPESRICRHAGNIGRQTRDVCRPAHRICRPTPAVCPPARPVCQHRGALDAHRPLAEAPRMAVLLLQAGTAAPAAILSIANNRY